jgi:hypothetical protein
VRVLDIWEDPSRPKEIEFVKCDIRDADWRSARDAECIDVVHHNVALVPLTKAGGDFWAVNVEGSRIAAEQAVKAGVKTFIHMSSSAIFGAPKTCPVTNDSPMTPVEIYGRGQTRRRTRRARTSAPRVTSRSSSFARAPSSASDGSASSRFCSSGFRRTARFTSSATATRSSSSSTPTI